MSGDHNMNQTSSAWRKRQIALDKKAENARELGLDYEPDKTTIEHMWKVASNDPNHDTNWYDPIVIAFAKLVAANEREACAKVCEKHGYDHYCGNVTDKIAETIRARGQA